MKTLKLIMLAFPFFFQNLSAQNSQVVICPKIQEDVVVDDLHPNSYPTHQDFSAIAWTVSGTPVVVRSYMQFEMNSIPPGFVLQSATLDLYHNPTTPNNSTQSSLSGSNEAVLSRVTSSWSGSSMLWSTQPSTTSLNEVTLPQSTSPTQNYLGVDVTPLVNDMLLNPTSSFGIQLRLRTESYYRCMIFASSDHADPTLHPLLCLTGTISTAIESPEATPHIQVIPNPAESQISVTGLDGGTYEAVVCNMMGQEVLHQVCTESSQLDVTDLSPGIYTLSLLDERGIYHASQRIQVF